VTARYEGDVIRSISLLFGVTFATRTHNVCDPIARLKAQHGRAHAHTSTRNSVKMDLTEIGCEGVDWIQLTQDRNQWLALMNTVMNLRVSYNAANFLTTRANISFSKILMLHGIRCICENIFCFYRVNFVWKIENYRTATVGKYFRLIILTNTNLPYKICMRHITNASTSKVRWSCPWALTKHHAMKAYRGSGGIALLILWPLHLMGVTPR
jgi:hypothetical protein